MSINHCYNVEDFRRIARRRLPAPIFHYLDGGSDNEWSLKNNQAAFQKYQLIPEYLRDISEVSLATTVLGSKLAAPLILSPTGMSRLFHHDKEFAVAKASESAGLMYSLSTLGTSSIEAVAAVKPGPKMFQVYIHKDRGLTKEFVIRAKAAGYDALCLTVDSVVAGNRERDKRTGFEMPPRLTLKSLASFALHPHWTFNLWRNPDFRLANVAHRQDALATGPMSVIEYVNSQYDRTVTWEQAGWLIKQWGGPFAIKGLQSPNDARLAVAAGASAIMLSNHGGRQLDCTPAPVDCIQPVRDAVGNDIELIVDGGVRRGTDALKALALGADAVSFGRPYLYALAAGGQQGVNRLLDLFRAELERGLALLGCTSIDDLCERHIQRHNHRLP